MGVFGQPPVHGFDKSEKSFDDQKWVLHLAAHGRFTPLNVALPVNEAFGQPLDASATAVECELLHLTSDPRPLYPDAP